MSELKQLVQLLNEIESLMIICMKCGMCQAVCPVFKETGDEGDVARGKIVLLERLQDQLLNDVEGAKIRIEKCLLCGSCASNCPSGVSILEIFIKARIALNEYMGLSHIKKLIFKSILQHPDRFNVLVNTISKFQSIYTNPAHVDLNTRHSKIISTILGKRHFQPFAKISFHRIYSNINFAPIPRSGIRVAIFPGCIIDKINPEIGEALLKVLFYHSVQVDMPQNLLCCGMPVLAAGDLATFETLVKQNVTLFTQKSFDILVTPCATCTTTIKKIWPIIHQRHTKAKLRKLAQKTMDISQFLVDVINIQSFSKSYNSRKLVTYHDPCHLDKSLGIRRQPRHLITASNQYELVEMQEANICCGNGGSFNIQHYELSREIGMRKRKNILASKADIVATSCPACMMQIRDMLSQKGDNVNVKHVIELYADSL